MITDYEKYQLQWMIDHGHSLQELMNVLADTANENLSMGGNVYFIFDELFEFFKTKLVFLAKSGPVNKSGKTMKKERLNYDKEEVFLHIWGFKIFSVPRRLGGSDR